MDAELRRVTIISLCVSGVDPFASNDDARRAQQLMLLMQESIYALEATTHKLTVGEKKIVLVAIFGTPLSSHFADDPMRALLTGARLVDRLCAFTSMPTLVLYCFPF